MATTPAVLISSPPLATPFFDHQGRITAPWAAWLSSIKTNSANLQSGVDAAMAAATAHATGPNVVWVWGPAPTGFVDAVWQ